MPPQSELPLRKTTMNLFEADVLAMERLYGRGWTEEVRRLVHQHVLQKRNINMGYGGEGVNTKTRS